MSMPAQGPRGGQPPVEPRSELANALRACRGAIAGIALASALINVLYLSGSIYMLEVYDRVLTSRSIPTLVGLTVMVVILYSFQGMLDLLRNRVLVRIGRSLGESLSERIYMVIGRLALVTRGGGDGLLPLRDIDQVRAFLSSPGPVALIDLPWMPFYILICFLFHFWLGATALAGALMIVSLTILTELMTRGPQKMVTELSGQRQGLAEASRRNAEALHAMGMGARIAARWSVLNEKFLATYQRTSDVSGGFGAMSKVMRMLLQSAVLGVGAYLVIRQEATAGIIIAGSILSARALAPVDLAIANWRGFVAFRQSWQRLNALLKRIPADAEQMALPKPAASLAVENLSVVPPGVNRVVVQDVSFRLQKGNGLGIVGPSASGKSCLSRVLVGVWPPARGAVRLDGAALDQWSPATLGPHIGYLPQNVELLSGTVAQNIARFEEDAKAEGVIAAAEAAGVHEMILRLQDGYDTEIGESGAVLSAGQRQRVALARALYGDPFLVVLDEPNSNLDGEGEEALTRAIVGVRARGGIVIVIAHRPSVLAGVDLLMEMRQGRATSPESKDEFIKRRRPTPVAPMAPAATGLRVVNEPGGGAP
jgi:ATP-binding cassette, subfamily C, type I secretion system permease/ATPase